MKTLLVIGGTGFFGKSILDAFTRGLLQPWHVTHIIVMSRNAQVLEQEAPQLINKNVTLLSADITSTDSLPYADFVIHAAASTDVRDYISQPDSEKKNIQAGTYNYCRLAKKFHRKSKIVYVSSGAVYGVQLPSIEELDELSKPNDLSNMDAGKQDYAVAKQDAELAITQLGVDGLNVSIARCFAFVGCWLPRDQHFAVGNFIDNILERKPIVIKSKHKVYRSYMYVDDLVEWLMKIANYASESCPIFNVGSDDALSLDDLVRELGKLYKLEVVVPEMEFERIDRYIPEIKKAKKQINVKLNYSSIESITKTIEILSSRADNET